MPAPLPLAIHVAHRLHSRGVGYTAIGVAAFASWVGLPGPGEAALIAGGAWAARGRLDIVQVELVALACAFVGGIVGFALGMAFGVTLAERPGPLLQMRKRALAAGERFYAKWGPFAVLLTPSWVAGIHRVKVVPFILFNLIACVIWAAMYGLATYFLGPRVAEYAGDIGTFATAAIVIVAVTVGTLALLRRRRRRSQA